MEQPTAEPRRFVASLRRVAVVALGLSAASNALAAGDPAAGRAVYADCAPCHGAAAEGVTATGAPSLAGQSGAYLARQLQAFRSGLRGDAADPEGAAMRPVSSRLDDAAIADVVAFVETLPLPVTPVSVTGDLRSGSNLYQSKCNACHGPNAEGNASLHSPRLAGISDGYLLRQLGRFRSGVRGGHPDDRLGRQMALIARSLPDPKAERDVIAFIRSLAKPAGAAAPSRSAE